MTAKRMTVASNHNGFEFLQLWRSIDSDRYGGDAILDLRQGDKVIASIESGPLLLSSTKFRHLWLDGHDDCRAVWPNVRRSLGDRAHVEDTW